MKTSLLQRLYPAAARLPAATARAATAAEVLLLGLVLPALLLWWVPAQRQATVLLVLVLVPLWLGLRFGLLAGSLAALTTAAAVAALATAAGQPMEVPNAHMVVLLLAGVVCGEMRDDWSRQARRLQALSQQHGTRLKQFTSTYQALQVSHARLERQLADEGGNLRATLQQLRLRSLELEGAGRLDADGLGRWLLEVFADLGNLYAAALYPVNERGVLQAQAVASLGPVGSLSAFHPMLRETLESGEMTASANPQELPQGQVIALVPLVDSRGRVHGVLAIFDMLYASMHVHTFEVLAVLGRHVGDILAGRPLVAQGVQGVAAFKQALRREWLLADAEVYPVALVACTITSFERREELSAQLCHGIRGLDQCWCLQDKTGQPVILKTMPLTDAQGVASYLARMEQKWPGGGFGYACHHWMLHAVADIDALLAELDQVCLIELAALDAPDGRKTVNGGEP